MSHNTVHVIGIGAAGPGFADWPALAALLRQAQHWSRTATQAPQLQVLPAAERRRIGMVVKLALSVGLEASQHAALDPAQLGSVFSSSHAEAENCHALCEVLASADRAISPTRFHNSVHNTSSGYWSIATGCMAPSTSLCAFDASFAAGLLEASTQVCSTGKDCLLVVHDGVYPHPLGTARPIIDNIAIALVLSATARTGALATLHISLNEQAASPCPLPEFKALQDGAPSARALPLLHAIATGQTVTTHLEYLEPLSLCVKVSPCP